MIFKMETYSCRPDSTHTSLCKYHVRYFVKILTQCLHQLRRGPRNRRVVLELSETDSKHMQTLKQHPTIDL